MEQFDNPIQEWLLGLISKPTDVTRHQHAHQDDVYRITTAEAVFYLKISTSLEAECQNLSLLKNVLNVPDIVGFLQTDNIDYLLISELPGKNLVELIDDYSPEQITEVFAAAVRELHDVDARKVFKGAKKDDVLIHGDMALPNIIVDEDGSVGYIDFGKLNHGTNEIDLYDSIWSMQRNLGHGYGELFLEKYGKYKLTPKLEEILSYRHSE